MDGYSGDLSAEDSFSSKPTDPTIKTGTNTESGYELNANGGFACYGLFTLKAKKMYAQLDFI